MTNILITGGTGFIGIPLVKKLHELGHGLKLLIRESSNTTPFKELNNLRSSITSIILLVIFKMLAV
ncbi:MAG: NAD-dependent epimerase/dehydratase family protein [Promethearchaeota archaeon]